GSETAPGASRRTAATEPLTCPGNCRTVFASCLPLRDMRRSPSIAHGHVCEGWPGLAIPRVSRTAIAISGRVRCGVTRQRTDRLPPGGVYTLRAQVPAVRGRQDALDAYRLSGADRVALRAEADRICRIADVNNGATMMVRLVIRLVVGADVCRE